MRPLIIAAAVAAVSLAACGKKPEAAASAGQGGYAVTTRDGDTVTTQTVAPATALATATPGTPGKMPAFAPLYPGAVVKATSASTANGHQVSSVTYVTTASPQAVIDFYKPRTLAAGFAAGTEANIGVGLMYAANDTAGQRTMQVIATAERDGTAVVLSWTSPTS